MTVLERNITWDLALVEAPAPQTPPAGAVSADQLPLAAGHLSLDEVLDTFEQCRHEARVVLGGRQVLEHLSGLPGASWNDRWAMFEAETETAKWRPAVTGAPDRDRNVSLTQGLAHLIFIDAIRPSYEWNNKHRQPFWRHVADWRDPEGMRLFRRQLAQLGLSAGLESDVVSSAGQICAHTGKTVRQLELADILQLNREIRARSTRAHRGTRSLFATLHGLGWIDHPTGIFPQATKRQPARSVEDIVDSYQIRQPQRDVWVEYLKQRSAGLDYSSTKALIYNLVGVFWSDIQRHHPDLDSFALDAQMLEGWRRRNEFKADGSPRRGLLSVLIQIRAFYLDIGQWAHSDSFWAPWATPCPVPRTAVKKQQKYRRNAIARLHQRTRDLAPFLPQIVDLAHREKMRTAKVLAQAVEAGPGGTVTVDGKDWVVHQASPHAGFTMQHGREIRRVSDIEAAAFWGFAAVEVLRHTGIRIEEMLELTHLSLQLYTVRATGETIPLLHIAPAKNDIERLLVASPELASVLAEIIKRIRIGPNVPLTQRWDNHEHIVSDWLPHLFIRPFVKELRVITAGSVRRMITQLCRQADLRVGGQPVTLTPHDFRRLFATEALASGLPTHIVAELLGHKSLATTQGYAAIYPQDVIRHHRTFISTRRQTRPSEEYREPTQEEWAEFEAHFVQRQLSLGTCGRAYGTNCHHEHACLRCALLRPDPGQADRLRDIIDNLGERIEEAEQANWVGEVEGLRVSLAGARQKLEQMERHSHSGTSVAVDLGLPDPSTPRSNGSR